MILPIAICLYPSIIILLPGVEGEHIRELLVRHRMVGIFMDEICFVDSLRFFPGLLLFGGIAEDQKGSREYIPGKLQQVAHLFAVFHNIADVAGADPKAFGRGDRILRGDQRVIDCQQKIPGTRPAGAASGSSEGVVPFFTVRAEGQHQVGFRYKGLVVAEVGQTVLNSWSVTSRMV